VLCPSNKKAKRGVKFAKKRIIQRELCLESGITNEKKSLGPKT